MNPLGVKVGVRDVLKERRVTVDCSRSDQPAWLHHAVGFRQRPTPVVGVGKVVQRPKELHGGSVDWGRLADWDSANWTLVLLATSLPVGSIYFGSDLVAKVLHHRPIETAPISEWVDTSTNRSTADLGEPTTAPVTAAETPAALPPSVSVDLIELAPVRSVAAESARPRGATGRVPDAARSARPVRTADELLDEARSATADWSVDALTAEGIRKAVRTSPAKARVLRETLRAERAAGPVEASA